MTDSNTRTRMQAVNQARIIRGNSLHVWRNAATVRAIAREREESLVMKQRLAELHNENVSLRSQIDGMINMYVYVCIYIYIYI